MVRSIIDQVLLEDLQSGYVKYDDLNDNQRRIASQAGYAPKNPETAQNTEGPSKSKGIAGSLLPILPVLSGFKSMNKREAEPLPEPTSLSPQRQALLTLDVARRPFQDLEDEAGRQEAEKDMAYENAKNYVPEWERNSPIGQLKEHVLSPVVETLEPIVYSAARGYSGGTRPSIEQVYGRKPTQIEAAAELGGSMMPSFSTWRRALGFQPTAVEKAIDPYAHSFERGAAMSLLPEYEKVYKEPQPTGAKVAEFAGSFLPMSGAGKAAGRLLPNVSRLGQSATAGALYGGTEAAIQEENPLLGAAKGAALWPIMEAGGSKAIEAISKYAPKAWNAVKSRLGNRAATATAEEVTAALDDAVRAGEVTQEEASRTMAEIQNSLRKKLATEVDTGMGVTVTRPGTLPQISRRIKADLEPLPYTEGAINEARLGPQALTPKPKVGLPMPEPKPISNAALNIQGEASLSLKPSAARTPSGGTYTVGAEPNIPAGLKERGVSKNVRTDANRPDVLRDSISANPDVYKQLGNPETLAKAQVIFDEGLEPAVTKLNSLIDNMQPEAAPLVKMIADKLSLEGNVARARELLSNAAVKATQAGQFGQAFRILRDSDPATFLMTMEKQLKKLNEEGLKTYGKKWKDIDLTPDELNMIGKIELGNQKSFDDVMEKIQTRIADEMPAGIMEKVNAWRHISMLLNPKTHIRNIGGNAIMMGMRKSAQRVSGILQKVFLKEGDRTQAVFVSKEYRDLAKEYFEANKKDLLSGANKYQENLSLNMPDKRVFRKSRIGGKLGLDIDVLEKVRKFNYELLQKGDNPFFQNAYIDRLASYAQSKGIKDITQLPQEAFDIAKLEAEQATYKDASVIATFINKVKRTDASSSPGRKLGAVLTEAALPFTKTPINIIKRGIQYSPAGVINGLAGIKSAKGAASAIDEIAKGLTGTGIMGLGYLLASKGILTGKASNDADLKAWDANTGNSPFSILGKYTYDWAQPFAVPLTVGVEIYNALKDKPQDLAKMDKLIEQNDTSRLGQMALTAANGIMAGLNASGDTVFNMSIMKGVKTLLGSGTQGFMEGMAQLPQNYATQFIPTLSNQLAGTLDPTARQTYVKGNFPESFKNALVSRIPGASKSLLPKQTPLGQDVKRPESLPMRAFSQFLSPGIISVNQGVDPKIDAELRRLNELGFTKQFPTMVPNYIDKTQDYPRINLTSEETTRYQKRVGQLTLESFNKVLNDQRYVGAKDYINKYDESKNKTADETRADMLAKAIEEAKAKAKLEIVKSKGYKK